MDEADDVDTFELFKFKFQVVIAGLVKYLITGTSISRSWEGGMFNVPSDAAHDHDRCASI